MQLQPGQLISAPFLPSVAEVKQFELRAGYALLEVVLHDGHQTYKALRITPEQLDQIEILDQGPGGTTKPPDGQRHPCQQVHDVNRDNLLPLNCAVGDFKFAFEINVSREEGIFQATLENQINGKIRQIGCMVEERLE